MSVSLECADLPALEGLISKVRNLCGSAKGAKYDSQGQALSGAKRVAPGQYDIIKGEH